MELKFGDEKSIAYKKKFEEDKLKENAILVPTVSEEIYHEPEYEYTWKCPHCGEDGYTNDEECPYDNIIKCSCSKYLKITTE
jgi:hypothetical protein